MSYLYMHDTHYRVHEEFKMSYNGRVIVFAHFYRNKLPLEDLVEKKSDTIKRYVLVDSIDTANNEYIQNQTVLITFREMISFINYLIHSIKSVTYSLDINNHHVYKNLLHLKELLEKEHNTKSNALHDYYSTELIDKNIRFYFTP